MVVYVIHLKETDGDVHCEKCYTFQEAVEYIDSMGLCDEDVTVIHGLLHPIRDLRKGLCKE